MKYSSEWQTPAAVTLIRTSPGPGRGTGTSRISGGPPIAVYCSARMPSPSVLRGLRGTIRVGVSRTHHPLLCNGD